MLKRDRPNHAANGSDRTSAEFAMSNTPCHDPHWNSAMEWLLWLQESPDDPELRAACEAWQRASPANAQAWQRAARVWHLSGQLPSASRNRWPGSRRRRSAVITTAVAACLALLMVLLPAPQGTIDNPHGGPRKLVLEDGSRIWLKGGSSIRPQFNATHRQLDLLEGEIFLDVTPDPARPFIVHAADSNVEVTGTAFTVALDGTTLDVAVAHGSVRVENPQRATVLTQGQRLRLNTDAGLRNRMAIAPTHIAAWRHGQLIAADQPIGEVVDQLRSYHQGWILLRDDNLAAERVTGLYNLNDPQAALEALVQPHGGRVQRWSPFVLVIDR
ncbi:FecR domain-containing protein [Stutzerimonas kunmingensis]|uniref:FecR family protein n=1 Tax=Stutzerimonas kunmingensis TaxID=1211807 RepID=UPI0015CE8A9C|nr:FecR domain-containing protein [Gammaproteobacteria bacterium]